MKIEILAIGKLRGPEAAWSDEYIKRLGSTVTIKEYAAPKALEGSQLQSAEATLLLKNITAKSHLVVLDERGINVTSRDLARKWQEWADQGVNHMSFIIGGADGVTDAVRARANFLLSFGKATWPHRLVRIMILEQIYRAQQINQGHPYHRD